MAKPKLAEARPIAMPVTKNTKKSADTEEQIRARAYEIYLRRGGTDSSSDIDDWLEAEAEIRSLA